MRAHIGLRYNDFSEKEGIIPFPAYDGKLLTAIARHQEGINIIPRRLQREKEHELEHIKLI